MVNFELPKSDLCRKFIPVLENVSINRTDITIGKFDVGGEVGSDDKKIANQYGVNGVPCMIIFKDGIKKAKSYGVKDDPMIIHQFIDDLIDKEKEIQKDSSHEM